MPITYLGTLSTQPTLLRMPLQQHLGSKIKSLTLTCRRLHVSAACGRLAKDSRGMYQYLVVPSPSYHQSFRT